MPFCRSSRKLACACVAAHVWFGAPSDVVAQTPTATIEVRVEAPDGPPVDAAPAVQVVSVAEPAQSWAIEVDQGETVAVRRVPPGRYRIVSGNRVRHVEVAAGDEITVSVVPRRQGSVAETRVRLSDPDPKEYGTRFNEAALALLPDSGGVFGLLERSDPLVVTDRMEGGGTYLDAQRLGASGASWTQTAVRVGEVDVTDPDRTGFPMMYPAVQAFESVGVATAGGHPDIYGSGTVVTLFPRRAGAAWQRTIEFSASPPAMQSVNPLPNAPSIGRLRHAAAGSVAAGGPLGSRAGLYLVGTRQQSTRVERERLDELDSSVLTLSGHLTYRAGAQDHLRVFAQTDRLKTPTITRAMLVDRALQHRDRSTLLTAAWERSQAPWLAWSGHLTFAQAGSTPPLAGAAVVGTMERLRDGPVYELASVGESRRRRLSLDWRGYSAPVRWLGLRHQPEFGTSLSWSGARRAAPGASLIGELVDGEPARAWRYDSDGGTSRWSGSEASLWAADEIAVTSRIDIDLRLRLSTAGIGGEGTAPGIRWSTMSPAILGTWRAIGDGRLTFLAGFATYGARLPLSYLAFGDPHALSGSMHRWTDTNGDRTLQAGEVGTLLAALGPCCTNGRASTIAPDLHSPKLKEVRAGLQTRLTDRWFLRLGGTDRRQYRLVQAVNAANLPENYVLTHVEDKALDMLVDTDDQLLPVFSRLPASYGTDSYSLQNVGHNSARDHGLDLVLERVYDGRWGMLIGGTAHKSEGIGGNRGYRADENDQGVIGEVFSDPTSQTFARGRLFFERGYVAKWSAIYQLPYGLRGGTVARYQDGQHFTRVVIARDVSQGVEFVPALPRGLTRFTYAFTLDTRLEKVVPVGGRPAALFVDVFNLLNTNNEVEEDEVTGPAFRAPTAVQPPRTVRIGLRFSF